MQSRSQCSVAQWAHGVRSLRRQPASVQLLAGQIVVAPTTAAQRKEREEKELVSEQSTGGKKRRGRSYWAMVFMCSGSSCVLAELESGESTAASKKKKKRRVKEQQKHKEDQQELVTETEDGAEDIIDGIGAESGAVRSRCGRRHQIRVAERSGGTHWRRLEAGSGMMMP